MNRLEHIYLVVLLFACIGLFSCSRAGGNEPGSEYMPDMGHSIAYEANYYDYYSYNTWSSEAEYYQDVQPRKPVKGSVPIGYSNGTKAKYAKAFQSYPMNGHVDFPYENTEEDRLRATAEIKSNPFPITEANLTHGKEMYEVYCGICHGEKGDGDGYLVSEKNKNAVYPAQPANLINEEFTNASDGRFYFAIMHGKNVMGGYADKLSYKERWQVMQYVRSLQAKNAGKTYSPSENNFNQDITWTNYEASHAHEKMEAHDMKEDKSHEEKPASHDTGDHHDSH